MRLERESAFIYGELADGCKRGPIARRMMDRQHWLARARAVDEDADGVHRALLEAYDAAIESGVVSPSTAAVEWHRLPQAV